MGEHSHSPKETYCNGGKGKENSKSKEEQLWSVSQARRRRNFKEKIWGGGGKGKLKVKKASGVPIRRVVKMHGSKKRGSLHGLERKGGFQRENGLKLLRGKEEYSVIE